MTWWHQLSALLRFLFRRRALERQIDEELRSFLDHRADELERQGLARESAERRSKVECGGIESVKEEIRDVIPAGRFLDSWSKDVRHGVRILGKAPGFTAVAVLTLALGIGGTSAIFSVVKAVLLDPLPYANPSRLVLVWSEFGNMGLKRAPGSAFELQEIRARSRSFEGVGGIWANATTVLGEGEPEPIEIGSVTGDFFSILGARPLLGRTILPEDEAGRGASVILLSHALWKRRFGADPTIVGRTIHLDGRDPLVVGVMRPEFRMAFPPDAQVPGEIQAWLPFSAQIYAAPRNLYYLRCVGRLRPAVTLAGASDDLSRVAAQLRGAFKEFADDRLGFTAVPLHRDSVREIRPPLVALLAGIGFVLLIACVNVANLLLARAGVRRKEMALRAALGASRVRIFRQLLIENLILAGLGGIAGLLLGTVSLGRMVALAPAGLLAGEPVRLDPGILAFTAAITLGAGLLFGVWPAVDASRVEPIDALQQIGRATATTLHRRTRAVLVVSEVALGFVLLVGAGLLIRTFVAVRRVDPGFRAAHLLTFEIGIPGKRYPNDAAGTNLVRRVEEALRALPGVVSVGGVSHLPLDDYANWYSGCAPEGADEERKHGLMADHRSATPGYFDAVGATLVAGRLFDAADEEARRHVVVVDERLAREAWPGQDPVGKKLEFESITEGEFHPGSAEVVGVVRHIQHHALTRQVRGQIYIPFSQSVRWHISFVVRASGDPLTLGSAVRRALAQIDKDQAVAKLRPMTFYLEKAMAATRFTMVLASLFSALALGLAAIGLYGVVAYSVGQRAHEFGIRLALGARAGEIRWQVVREAMTLTLAGLALGAFGAIGISRVLASILFGVGPGDVATYALAAALLPAVALLACWLSTRRIASFSPLAILRAE